MSILGLLSAPIAIVLWHF